MERTGKEEAWANLSLHFILKNYLLGPFFVQNTEPGSVRTGCQDEQDPAFVLRELLGTWPTQTSVRVLGQLRVRNQRLSGRESQDLCRSGSLKDGPEYSDESEGPVHLGASETCWVKRSRIEIISPRPHERHISDPTVTELLPCG